MRFVVSRVLLLALALPTAVLADTVVDCSRPPGGQIRCPDALAAMCNVRSGAVFGQCLQPPQSSSRADRMRFVERIVGAKFDRPMMLSDDQIERAFSRGALENPIDGSAVRFKLPAGTR